jgi:hypothetical protein
VAIIPIIVESRKARRIVLPTCATSGHGRTAGLLSVECLSISAKTMGHHVQAIVGSKRVLDLLQQRFAVSRVVELSQKLFLLPMVDELYDALPSAADYPIDDGKFHFRFLSSKLLALLVEASREDAVAYFETEYYGGLGDQGAVVAKDGKIISGPKEGDGSINSALQLLGVKKENAYDEYEAIGLGRFRSNEDWLNQSSHHR